MVHLFKTVVGLQFTQETKISPSILYFQHRVSDNRIEVNIDDKYPAFN